MGGVSGPSPSALIEGRSRVRASHGACCQGAERSPVAVESGWAPTRPLAGAHVRSVDDVDLSGADALRPRAGHIGAPGSVEPVGVTGVAPRARHVQTPVGTAGHARARTPCPVCGTGIDPRPAARHPRRSRRSSEDERRSEGRDRDKNQCEPALRRQPEPCHLDTSFLSSWMKRKFAQRCRDAIKAKFCARRHTRPYSRRHSREYARNHARIRET